MKTVKQEQLYFKSKSNYDDLESEITRLEKERQSAENEHKLVHERLGNLLRAKDRDKAEMEGVWRDIKKISFKFRHLTSLVDCCQMMVDGTILLPKPRTDRPWSDDPIFDMYLEDQHWKRKKMGEEAWEECMKERMMGGGCLVLMSEGRSTVPFCRIATLSRERSKKDVD
jgi:hypothetical protein